jgi:IMP dehydrogenase
MSETQPRFLDVANYLERQDERSPIRRSMTFDDIKLLPGRSNVDSPSEVSLRTRLTDDIELDIPIISANMDSVTEEEMAIAMAINGGIGAIHRAATIDEQARMIGDVKDAYQYVIDDPPILTPSDTVGRAREIMEQHSRGYVVIIDAANKLHAICTKRDLHPNFVTNDQFLTDELLTTHEKGLVTAPCDISMEDAQRLMWQYRIEKLVLVDAEGNIGGVVTDRDIREIQRYPHATRDKQGRLQVLGSVGIGRDAAERAQALEQAGADGIIIDVLHGDTRRVKELTGQLKRGLHVPIIVGNVATELETQDLYDTGADVVKVGYGPGSFCTTQIVTGTGAAQWSAIVRSAAVAYHHNKTIIADGGIRAGGDIAKALAGGAAAVMLGGILVGTDKSPGELLRDSNGSLYKIGRGSASASAAKKFAEVSGIQNIKKRAAQGVEAIKIPYTGTTEDLLSDLADGVRHAVANTGGTDIKTYLQEVRFEEQTAASYAEGRPHATNKK